MGGLILSDRDILEYIRSGKLVIKPLDPDIQIQPSSVDLRLGSEFRVFKNIHVPYIDPLETGIENFTELIEIEEGEKFILHPGEFVLGTTLEWIEVPADLVARVEGRSSLGRLAIVVHATAGYVDPGFKGRITLELSNLGRVPVALYPGMRICQIVFIKMSSSAERPYGPERKSKYYLQEGPAASKIYLDGDLRLMKAGEEEWERDLGGCGED